MPKLPSGPVERADARADARAATCEHQTGTCSGPTGTWQPTLCVTCDAATYADTCWRDCQRIPTRTPVLCETCSDHLTLF